MLCCSESLNSLRLFAPHNNSGRMTCGYKCEIVCYMDGKQRARSLWFIPIDNTESREQCPKMTDVVGALGWNWRMFNSISVDRCLPMVRGSQAPPLYSTRMSRISWIVKYFRLESPAIPSISLPSSIGSQLLLQYIVRQNRSSLLRPVRMSGISFSNWAQPCIQQFWTRTLVSLHFKVSSCRSGILHNALRTLWSWEKGS